MDRAEPMGTSTDMSSDSALYKLQTWFSPSYPVGAYTYSHGLETAFETGLVTNVDEAIHWIGEVIASGNGFADAVFVYHSHAATGEKDFRQLSKIAEFASAFCGTAELRLESHSQGQAFMQTIGKVAPSVAHAELKKRWHGPMPYSVVVGALAGEHAIDAKATLIAYLHGFVANLSSALVRLVPLGQSDGQIIISSLGNCVLEAAQRAMKTRLEDVATSTLMVDILSMQHETQYTRLFRS